jgi:hypothetical protein
VNGDSFTHEFKASAKGEYRVQVEEGAIVQALTNPIALGSKPRPVPAGTQAGGRTAALKLSATPKRLRAGKTVKTRFTARSNGGAPLGGVLVRAGGRSGYTDSRGIVWLALKPSKKAKKVAATATGKGWKKAKLSLAVRR